MRRIKTLFVFIGFCMVLQNPVSAQLPFHRADVKDIMKKVADWQIKNTGKSSHEHGDLDWTNAALYIGMTDWADMALREDKTNTYYEWLLNVGKRNSFQVGKSMYHADYIAVGQPFIDMYLKYGDRMMLAPVECRADWVITHPAKTSLELDYKKSESLYRWSWCDALFMAPPVYAKLYAVTGKKKYLRFMNKEYKATYDFLYSKQDSLFYRDNRYFNQKEANGRHVFWGRGNGWVIAGLANILRTLKNKDQGHDFYEHLFVKMAYRLARLQSPDGCWHASLLDPASYPSPETSATGFILYALAYGVNEGILDKESFQPVLEKGWRALVDAVDSDGKLGYVQPIGADPRMVTREMTEVYGVGAFLAAGCQIYKLCNN